MTSIFSTTLSGFGFLIAIFDGEAILNDLNNYNGTQVTPGGSTSPAAHIGGTILDILN